MHAYKIRVIAYSRAWVPPTRSARHREKTPISFFSAPQTPLLLTMTTTHTNRFTFDMAETHVMVPMSGEDYDTCTELLRQLLCSGAIHSYQYDETTSSAIIYHFAKVEEGDELPHVGDVAQS